MNARRFAWVVMMLAGGMLLLTLYVQKQQSQRGQGQPESPQAASSTRPADSAPAAGGAAASAPASGPATSAPQAQGPLSSAPSGGAAAGSTPAQDQWVLPTKNLTGAPQTLTIGSLAPPGTPGQKQYLFQAELTSRGAAIENLKLTRFFQTVGDKRLYDKDPQAYEKLRRENPARYKGHYQLLSPVSYGEKTYLPYATRKLWIYPAGGAPPVPVRLDDKLWDVDGVSSSFALQTASFSLVLYRQYAGRDLPPQPILRVVKAYTLRRGDYSLALSLALENLSQEPLKVAVDQGGATGVAQEDLRSDDREAAYGKLNEKAQQVQPSLVPIKDLSKKEVSLDQVLEVGKSNDEKPVLWLGEVNKFFGSMMYLQPVEKDKLAAGQYKAAFYYVPVESAGGQRTFLTGVKLPDLQLAGDGRSEIAFNVFAGPKVRTLLSEGLYGKLNYLGTINLAGCFCAWDQLTLGLMWLLEKLSILSLGNYGVAIILLVFLVRLVLHPLTKRGQVSMSKMQKLGPQMQKLKEKYADDKNALNREMMQLYKQGGATPILGCLPMFLQMPIWVGLWTALNATVELRHAAFLPFWITDLAAPDALFSFPAALPLVGSTFNMLPLLLTVAMYLQSKLSPPMGAPSAQQAQQQKMMNVMMPGMMLVFFYHAPSGLTLYIMASTFAGVIEQYVIRKHIRERDAREAATEATVAVPGKGARSARPKKPKGPFWVKQ